MFEGASVFSVETGTPEKAVTAKSVVAFISVITGVGYSVWFLRVPLVTSGLDFRAYFQGSRCASQGM